MRATGTYLCVILNFVDVQLGSPQLELSLITLLESS
jgi:hypothetical protein